MFEVTLPDGSKKQFASPISVHGVAASIGSGLADAALAGKVDGVMVDTSFVIDKDASLVIVTDKDEAGLEVIRHSCAHLLAQAVKQLFPKAQVTIGPVIEDGFYYDFAFERAFNEEDLVQIEQRMYQLAKNAIPVERSELTRREAVKLFQDLGEEYKVDIITSLPEEKFSFYRQAEFIDLCRGPHVPNTSKLKAFKLTKVAGAYWRGDSNNAMLQRIYGTAWSNKKDLTAYLTRMEEALKRDHRKIAKKLNLFHVQEEAPGMVFWHPAGWSIYQTIEQHIRNRLRMHNYQEVRTPQIVDRSLWEKSGHWDMFAENMFTVQTEDKTYAVKPMNCPCHVQIYNKGLKSYKDLPLRLAEFGSCHRNEPSGTLHGLMRVRNFVQDDAHIFCTEDQIQSEVSDFIDLLFDVYKDFGFEEVIIKLSTRPDKRVGSDEIWDKAEGALALALNNKSLDWEELPKEGAFYGPKIEFSLKDCIGRVWQCGTIQVDFSMPDRLGASYIAEDGAKYTPVMLHRAILGSLERFVGILLEEHEGSLPAWLSPIQVAVISITDRQNEYAQKVASILQKEGFRVLTDLRNEKIGFKIRERTLQKVPFMVILGDKEESDNDAAVRGRDGTDLGVVSLTNLVNLLKDATKIR